MSEGDDIAFWLGQLASSDARARVRCLRAIAEHPVADRSLLAACETLLDDREVCLVQIPYRFGQVRLVAAVAELRERLGIDQGIVILEGFIPLTTDDVARLARATGVPMQGAVDGTIATFRELIRRRSVPTRTFTRP